LTHCTIAVIGHVDHGKTALVRALTGVETDRLKEEQQRGLSIALGFAWCDGPSGGVDIIDTPGHEDFIRTMAAGVAGARAVLLVVSAVDGFERQTFEHLQIATLLGIDAGIVAVTKSDLLVADDHAKTAAAIKETLAETPLCSAPVVFCSTRTGAGLDTLRGALDALAQRCTAASALPGFYLPIDRVFTVRGIGAVVTGTLTGGALRTGDSAVVQPSDRAVTIRGLQARGAELGVIEPGRRAAVNIRGAAMEDIRVGDILCPPGLFPSSRRLDAKVSLTPDGARPLKHLDEVRVLLGTRAIAATARLIEGGPIAPGGWGWVQFRFERDIVAHAGQRAVLRRLSPSETIGGAIVLDPTPSASGRRNNGRIDVLRAVESGDTLRIAFALAARDGGLSAIAELARLTHQPPDIVRARLAADFETLDDQHLVSRRTLEEATRIYLAALRDAHRVAPTKPGKPLASIRRVVVRAAAPALVELVERRLVRTGEIILASGHAALATHDPIAALSGDARARLEHIEVLLHDGAAAPPDLDALIGSSSDGADLMELLVAAGRVVALKNFALRKTLLFHPAALDAALKTLTAAFPSPTTFKTGEAREALATSRKFIVPILEFFDARGWTIREGDLRRIARR